MLNKIIVPSRITVEYFSNLMGLLMNFREYNYEFHCLKHICYLV